MKQYPAEQIRNVAILGHSGSGKTSFAEAMLFNAKVTDRLGKSNDGTTTMDYEPEERKRNISISMALAAFDWKGTKINLLDTPGDFDFMGEVTNALRVVDSALIVLSGRDGFDVGSEKSVRYCRKGHTPFFYIVNKLDDENSKFDEVVAAANAFSPGTIPFVLPLREGRSLTGFVDIIHNQAYTIGANGRLEKSDMPQDAAEEVGSIREQLNEVVAETNEELMEKYFEEEAFTEDEFYNGLKQAILAGDLHPVFAGCSTDNQGIDLAMDLLVDLAPSPLDVKPVTAWLNDGVVEVECDPAGPYTSMVFKTMSDAFVGRISLFRVYSGTVKNGDTLYNPAKEVDERINGLMTMVGKKTIPVESVAAGDIGAAPKLQETQTGDTLAWREPCLRLEGIEPPVAPYAMAIMPVTQGDEEKIVSGLNKLADEDMTFKLENNAETGQLVIYGLGATQIDVLRSKLKSKFKVDSIIEEPRVPYRETIKKKVRVQGRHKKQSGGHGQYGDVWIEFEPGEEEGLTFEVKTVGGSVPKQYNIAVEKGLNEAVAEGVLAGYPMVRLKASLVDGSYHSVDSSEMAFKLAANLAYKSGIPQAKPTILEPIATVSVYVPEAQLGDIMSDINGRRGRIMGVEPRTEVHKVDAEVPLSEMSTYATDLRSMTQGRGWYSIAFDHYEEAPQPVQEKVIADAQARREAE